MSECPLFRKLRDDELQTLIGILTQQAAQGGSFLTTTPRLLTPRSSGGSYPFRHSPQSGAPIPRYLGSRTGSPNRGASRDPRVRVRAEGD